MVDPVVRRARRARRRAVVVPVLVSAPMVLVLGELVLRRYGALLVIVWVAAAALAQTPLGLSWTCRLFCGARAPLLHQRYTLAPVAQVLLAHGTSTTGLALLVGRGHLPTVQGFGPGLLVVSRGFVEAVREGVLGPRLAAAIIAHEMAVMRAGLTRAEPCLHVLRPRGASGCPSWPCCGALPVRSSRCV